MKQSLIITAVVLFICSQAIAQTIDTRPTIAIPWTNTSPVIDGNTSQGEWDESAGVCGFIEVSGSLFPKPVNVKITWNDNGLFVCFVSDQNSIKTTPDIKNDDDSVAGDDAVEVFLQAKEGRYCHFITNSAGAKYDALVNDPAWNSGWQTASSVDGNRLTVEVFIPYSTELPKPNDGDQWSFNLCRDFKDPVGWTSLAPMDGTFHNPKSFGILKFVRNIPVVSMESIDIPKPAGSIMKLSIKSPIATTLNLEWQAVQIADGKGLGSRTSQMQVDTNAARIFEIPLVAPVPPVVGKKNELSFTISRANGGILQRRYIPFVIAEDMTFKLTPDRKEQKVHIVADITGLRSKATGNLKAAANIKDASGKIVKTTSVENTVGNTVKLDIDMSGLSDGKYTTTVDISSNDGSVLSSKSAVFSRFENPDWKNNKIGMDDNVPAPWIPLKLNGSKLTCWNRTYDFGKGAFPASILSGSSDLLSSPMYLNGIANNKPIKWKFTSSKNISVAKSTVVFTRKQESEYVSMSSKITCDFDGMMRFDITLTPKNHNTEIGSLALKIPIPDAYSKYLYGSSDPYNKDLIGKLNTPWSSDFIPGLWVGNETTGIGWFAEGKMNWNQTKPGKTLEIVQNGNSRVMTVNFIDTPTNLNKPITLTFGMQATPTKPFPRPKDWLTYRPVTVLGNKLFFSCWGGETRWGGFPVIGNDKANPGDPGEFDDSAYIASLKSLHDRGFMVPAYLTPATAVTSMPETDYYKLQWEGVPEILTLTDNGQQILLVCSADKDWQDLFIKRLQEFMTKYNNDAIYMDWGNALKCSNQQHGCGYTKPDGTIEGTYPVFALHEMHKRIYKVMRAAKPNSPFVTIGHPVGTMGLPHTNFWQGYVEGEYAAVIVPTPKYNGDYTAFYSPERYTVEFSGRNWGSIPLMLSYVSEPAKSRTVFALALMTGAIAWPANLDKGVELSTWTALDKFGVNNIEEFLPYWANKGAVKWTGGDKVFVTTYRNKGKALLIVSNLGPDAASVDLNLNQKILKTPGLTITDPVSGNKLSENSRSIQIDVPAKDFKLLMIE